MVCLKGRTSTKISIFAYFIRKFLRFSASHWKTEWPKIHRVSKISLKTCRYFSLSNDKNRMKLISDSANSLFNNNSMNQRLLRVLVSVIIIDMFFEDFQDIFSLLDFKFLHPFKSFFVVVCVELIYFFKTN